MRHFFLGIWNSAELSFLKAPLDLFSFFLQSTENNSLIKLLMPGFEPRSYGVGSDRSAKLCHNHCPNSAYLTRWRKYAFKFRISVWGVGVLHVETVLLLNWFTASEPTTRVLKRPRRTRSVTRWLDYFLNICPFTTIKITH